MHVEYKLKILPYMIMTKISQFESDVNMLIVIQSSPYTYLVKLKSAIDIN